ncbi:hypothetical protein BH20GEM1_BH20GEM1_01490 [soil metagenome]
MVTKLEKPLKRELDIDGEPYVVTISTEGFKVVPKGRRKGPELAWKDLVGGEAALAAALNASLKRGGKQATELGGTSRRVGLEAPSISVHG